ncbi:hypothetical protein FKM82_003003 [Ascaphus truei]
MENVMVTRVPCLSPVDRQSERSWGCIAWMRGDLPVSSSAGMGSWIAGLSGSCPPASGAETSPRIRTSPPPEIQPGQSEAQNWR